MYLNFSFKNIFFYKLKKLLSILFSFDWTWRAGSIVAFILVLITSVLSMGVSAQTTTGSTKCGSVLHSSLSEVAYMFTGPQACTNYIASLKESVVGSGGNLDLGFAPITTTNGKTTNLYDPDNFRYGGAVSAIMFAGGAMSDFRPASTYDAVIYQANQAGIVTHAQVQGASQLNPIVTLWSLFRNIALLLFVVVFVAIGFFILLQRKIGGQETVSLVSGIINAAVAMIFITFSYAIGGLIIDLFVNVSNGVVASTFNNFINSQEIYDKLKLPNSGVNVLTLMSELSNVGVSSSASNLFQSALTGLNYPAQQVKQVFSNINAGPNIPIANVNIGSAVGLFASTFVDILTGIITTGFNNNTLINAIVAFIIFIIMIRVVFVLLGAYVQLVFKVMFAPFILLPAALPGNAGKTIMGWLLSLIGSALTFPAIFACILMAAMFLNLNGNIDTTGATCGYKSELNPSFQGTIQGNIKPSKYIVVQRIANDNGDTAENEKCYPLVLPPKFNYWPAPLGFINGVEPDDLIRFVIALAFILVMPSVPKILQSLLKIPQDNLLAGISSGFKSGTGTFSSFISAIPSFGVGRAIGSVTKGAADSAG